MLGSITIDSYQRIAEAFIDLTGVNIHVFSGGNEDGKSTIIEAVAFAIRGLSPRVKLKGQYDELIFKGKKNGSVSINLDGFDVHRKIKKGELTTAAPLDYPDMLVDIQLGRERFGRVDEKVLRKMLMTVFDIEGSHEYVTQRLKNRGIDEVIIKKCIPLLSAGGFTSAAQAADDQCKELRAKWAEVTDERYGSEKAQDWKPEDLMNFPEVRDEDLNEAKRDVAEQRTTRDAAQRALGTLDAASKRAEALNITETADELTIHLGQIRGSQQEFMESVAAERKRLDEEVESCNVEIESLKSKIDSAKMAASTLECPACAKPLVLHTEDKLVRLVSAEKPRRDGPSLDSLLAELNDTKAVKEASVSTRTAKINEFDAKFKAAMKEAALLEEKLKLVQEGATKVTAESVSTAQENAEMSEAQYQKALSWLNKLERDKEERSRRLQKQVRAKQLSTELDQWVIVASALGNNADSIPSELLQKTIGPVNDVLTKVSRKFSSQPIAIDSSMHLSRGDGTPYYMLSRSARWRAEVSIRLALAALSKLKLVAIDEFDVLVPSARPAFFEMLQWYTTEYKDVTVLCMGTLKSKPDLGEGIKSWWVQEGVVS